MHRLGNYRESWVMFAPPVRAKRLQWKIALTGMYNNDAMQARQIAESVRISKVPEGKLMNTREEWNFFQLPRAVVED